MSIRLIKSTGRFSAHDQRRQSGLTLIELMIAMTIGLILLVALGQLFVTTRSTHKTEEGYARAQEAGRFSMEFLRKDIRMAGYAGCNNPSASGTVQGNGAGTTCTTNFCNLADPADDSTRFAAEGVRGYTYTGNGTSNNLTDWTPNLPAVFFANGDVKPNTGVILIQYAVSTGTNIVGNPIPDNANVKIPSTSPLIDGNASNGEIVQNDIVVISDCKNTDVFRITSDPYNAGAGDGTLAHANSNNLSAMLTHSYGNDAEILTLASIVYYIEPNNAANEPALMRRSLGSGGVVGAAQELVEGVEDMRFLYGVDTDTPRDKVANRYVLANDVVDLTGLGTTTWDDVATVRLGLLIRTPAGVDQTPDSKTYELVDGVDVGPFNDNRRRQVYRTTIEIRN
jgi:type IV pilus assembly protein PilW